MKMKSSLLPMLLLFAAAPAQAESWTADMQIDRTRSAGFCQRGALNTYTLDWSGSTLAGRLSLIHI